MADDGDVLHHHHQRGAVDDAVNRNLREDPAATGTTAAAASSEEKEEEEEGFTFASAAGLAGGGGVFGDGRVGPVYPVFGRPRSPPSLQEAEDTDTATVRVPLGQLLLEERGSPSGQQPEDDHDDGGELDGVPAETYCLWSPGSSPSPSPARCQKSGSTGSVLRWRQRLAIGRSHSDGKQKFVFLDAGSPGRKGRAGAAEGGTGGGREWSYYRRGGGRGSRSRPSFLPYKQTSSGSSPTPARSGRATTRSNSPSSSF